MGTSLAGHVRSNAVAYLSLFVALGGTAYSAATIGAGDIRPNAVRAKHIKDGQVKGPEVVEASLDEVPAAGNADLLDDLDSGAFVPANSLQFGGPVTVDDPAGGGSTNVPLFTVGPVTVIGECTETTPTTHAAAVTATSSFPAARIETISAAGAFDVQFGGGKLTVVTVANGGATVSDEIRHASTVIIGAISQTAWTGQVYSGVNLGADCVFGYFGAPRG
jgi:hypothetical protein